MAEKKKVTVKIKAKEYVINCTEEEEYVQKIAYYVDRKLKKIETFTICYQNTEKETTPSTPVSGCHQEFKIQGAEGTIEFEASVDGDVVTYIENAFFVK